MFEPPAVTADKNLVTAASSTFFSEASRCLLLRSADFLRAFWRHSRHSDVK
jgi:hypothetical protein